MTDREPNRGATREELIARAKPEHDKICSCDPRYLMSCPKMAAAILDLGNAKAAVAQPCVAAAEARTGAGEGGATHERLADILRAAAEANGWNLEIDLVNGDGVDHTMVLEVCANQIEHEPVGGSDPPEVLA